MRSYKTDLHDRLFEVNRKKSKGSKHLTYEEDDVERREGTIILTYEIEFLTRKNWDRFEDDLRNLCRQYDALIMGDA